MSAAAVLHRKVLGLPVWAVGGLGAVGVVLFHFLHPSGVGGAAGDTTPANTDATTGDPYAVDSGVPVPTQYGYGSGGNPADYGGVGGASSGGGDTSYADALASLGDSLAGLTPVDHSADFASIEAMLGTIADQTAPDHSEGDHTTTTKKVVHDDAAKKANTAHAAARGGHAATVPKKSPAKAKAAAPARKAAPVTHPKATMVAKHAPAPPPPKKKAPPKKSTAQAKKNR